MGSSKEESERLVLEDDPIFLRRSVPTHSFAYQAGIRGEDCERAKPGSFITRKPPQRERRIRGSKTGPMRVGGGGPEKQTWKATAGR